VLKMKELRFRCSSLPSLMTNGRGKTPSMGETAKNVVRDTWLGVKYGRWPQIKSKYLAKGNLAEEDSLTLYTQYSGKIFIKNETNFKNDYLTGTPDTINPELIDIKTPFDIWTFSKVDEASALKAYEWQLRGYMMLTGAKSAKLVYCLTNMPASMLSHELYKLQFDYADGENDLEYQAQADQIERNYIYDDIDINERVKVFEINHDEAKEAQLIERVNEAREYAKTLRL